VVPSAVVRHAERSQENSDKLYHLVLSGLLFFAKHGSFWQRLYYGVYGTIRRIKNALDRVRGRKARASSIGHMTTFFMDIDPRLLLFSLISAVPSG